jgi:hypothetical protein
MHHTILLILSFAHATTLLAQAPRERPFAGRWSLEFSASTRPGGATLQAGPITISPQNLHFQAHHREFTVSDDGKFDWTERTNGQWHSDATTIDSAGQRSFPSQTNEPLLKVEGQLDRQRKLTVTLRWSHGSGPFLAGDGVTPGSLSVSADGDQVTVFFKGHSSSHATRYLTTEWALPPPLIERQELSPDMVRETATYSARRERTLNEFGAGPLPVIERVRVQQVRQLKLVPRG